MGLIVQSWVQNGWARWAARFAFFAVQLAFVAFIIHRTHIVGTPLGLGLLAVAGGLAVLGGLLALVAFVRLWHYGGLWVTPVVWLSVCIPAIYLIGFRRLPQIPIAWPLRWRR